MRKISDVVIVFEVHPRKNSVFTISFCLILTIRKSINPAAFSEISIHSIQLGTPIFRPTLVLSQYVHFDSPSFFSSPYFKFCPPSQNVLPPHHPPQYLLHFHNIPLTSRSTPLSTLPPPPPFSRSRRNRYLLHTLPNPRMRAYPPPRFLHRY